MDRFIAPFLFALFAWWFSTGVILALNLLPRRARAGVMVGATAMLVVALAVLWAWRSDASVVGAYVCFTAALAVWAWIEIAFLTGVVTGPSRAVCPPEARGLDRFRRALATLLWHEAAILAGFALVLVAAAGKGAVAGVGAYAVLLVMRLSAKINIYLGAPNAPFAFLPEHLRHLGTYFRERPINGLFPISVTLATLLTAWLAHEAWWAHNPAEAAAYTMLAALAAFGVLEHWFLVLPLPSESLWRWALPSRKRITKSLASPLSGVSLTGGAESSPQRSRP